MSALRLLTPDAAVWAPFVFGAGAVGLAVGYLTPGPQLQDPDEEADFIAARERQYARISGGSDDEYLAARAAQPALGEAPASSLVFADPPPAAPALEDASPPQLPPAADDTVVRPPAPHRDTTVQASRSDLDSIFGSEYGPDERGQR